MRLIDAHEAEEQVRQTQILTKTERDLLVLALNRTPTYDPPNDPLTLEELQEMDGEPVWVEEGNYAHYVLITDVMGYAVWTTCREDESEMLFEDYGKTWLAYRRKPEEGTVT